MAAEAGVDDVELIVALALHRRMTEAGAAPCARRPYLRRLRPQRAAHQHDAEDPDALVHLGPTDQGEDVEINKRAAESRTCSSTSTSTWWPWTAGTRSWPPAWPATGASATTTTPSTMMQSRSFMDQHRSELHTSNWRMGRLIADVGVNVFQIETNLNNDAFPPQFRFLQKREWEWSAKDRPAYLGASTALDRTPASVARQIFHSVQGPAPDDRGPGR